MKKFYNWISAAVLLLTGLTSQGQTFYQSINNNTTFTYDDPRFWIGAVPPNPCTNCFININSSVIIPHAGQSSAPAPTSNVFTTQAPSFSANNDGLNLTVGMLFQSTLIGQVTGVRFYRNAIMGPGTHVGALYTSTGTLLASFALPAASETVVNDWQDIVFSSPVTIQPGVTYVAAVYMGDGFYVASSPTIDPGKDFSAGGITNGNMVGLADNGVTTHNGVYIYGNALTFPTQFYTPGTNYYVDVAFTATPPDLSDFIFNGSNINARGTVDLNVNTVTHLNGTALSMGNEPTFTQNLFVNDQMFLDPSSSIQLANTFTTANANNDFGNAVQGNYIFVGSTPLPGIYTIRGASPGPGGATDITLNAVLNSNWNGSYTTPVSPYPWNCVLGSTCADGVVFGPAITQYDATNDFYGFNQSTVLPVVLVQLLATRNTDGSIKVSWATAQEQNSSYYDIERSSDGAGWAKIGSVKAKGYASTTSNYSFNDNAPLDAVGYYRLKMVDLDGKFTYSKTVSVSDNKSKVPLVIYSNPFRDQIRMKVNVSRSQNLIMTVTDMMGKTYLSQSIHAQSGDNMVNLIPQVSASGMYILRIHGDSYDQSVKLEKQ
jgi:Domain of unknown function (DUF4082)